ncbi:NAD(P)-dependent oxidoreductase [Streptomyces bambusae]|uniref:NAD(P)-dependent oxidoreductase n=1 Tax=Streptomyces bambusae TaxID=1550616 RepID=A0ABS6ZJS9_9ACTN|nr:NAD(P)-binding domain-containing protein [Streptomyces bambusae]MBW5486936.1 NAD(P)-dependent oxidoreductase [Streptomyces bambusae]
MSMASNSVTVVGLGPMGRAMTGALLDAGREVTVWNRSAGKDTELVARGARRAGSIEEAVQASGLVVLSLIDVDAMYGTLGEAPLQGRVLANLSSDTPQKARAAAAWAAARGAAYLTGGINVPPDLVGKPEATVFVSGAQAVYEEHRASLDVLAATDWKGEDPGLAQLFYQLNMIMFWTAMTGFDQAVAVAQAGGLTAADILPYAAGTTDSMSNFLHFYAPRIDKGEHGGDVDRLAMCAASLDHVVHTAADSGVDTGVLQAHADLYRRGVEAGFGADSSTRLVELLRRTGATA